MQALRATEDAVLKAISHGGDTDSVVLWLGKSPARDFELLEKKSAAIARGYRRETVCVFLGKIILINTNK